MAPKSAAERAKKYRQRMKEKDENQFKEKNAIRMKKARAKYTGKEKRHQTERSRERMRHYRLRKSEQQEPLTVPYKSKQAMGKAMSRLKKNLPHSPRKQRAVITKLAEASGIALLGSARQITRKKLAPEVKLKIKQFYNQDDISRQLPGRKDVKVVKDKETGEKKTLVKRLLMYNLREAFILFKEQNLEIMIGLSKFCELRPVNILLVSFKSQEVCCCPYCENIKFIFNSLKWSTMIIKSLNDLVEYLTCNSKSSICMQGSCKECCIVANVLNKMMNSALLADERQDFSYMQWKGGKLEIISEVSVEEAAEELMTQLLKYKKHIFIYKMQYEALKKEKEEMTEGKIVLQTDFAENYAIKHQSEVMAAHWMPATGESVTIYTAIAHFLDPTTGIQTSKSYAIVSNTTDHGTLQSQVFNGKIIDHLRSEEGVLIERLSIWTDGAAAHFKNKKAMAALTHYRDLHSCIGSWNFNESYHGKGPHDGIGAVLKWNVYRKVMQGKTVVRSASDFYKISCEITSKTVVLYVSNEDIDSKSQEYNSIWENCKPAKMIQRARSIRVQGKYKIAMYSLSNDTVPYAECNLSPNLIESDHSESVSPSSSSTSDFYNNISDLSDNELAINEHGPDFNIDTSEIETPQATPDLPSRKSYDLSRPSTSKAPPHSKRSLTDLLNLEVETEDFTNKEGTVTAHQAQMLPGSFVLLKYVTKQKVLHYIAVIEDISVVNGDSQIEVKCLKKTGIDRKYQIQFQFPNVEDKDYVTKDSIVKVLQCPTINRMTYTFPNEPLPAEIN